MTITVLYFDVMYHVYNLQTTIVLIVFVRIINQSSYAQTTVSNSTYCTY